MGLFDSMTTSALTVDNKYFRMTPGTKKDTIEAQTIGASVSSTELLDLCDAGLALPVFANLDMLNMGMMKTLINSQSDFFGTDLPEFKRYQVQEALAWALSMVHTGRTKESEDAEVCTPDNIGNVGIPSPSHNIMQVLLGKKGAVKYTSDNVKIDSKPLINRYGRPTELATTMLQEMSRHAIAADSSASDQDVLDTAAAKASITNRIVDGAQHLLGRQTQVTPGLAIDTEMTTTLAVATALSSAKIAAGNLDDTIKARLQSEGFTDEQQKQLIARIELETKQVRYTPNLLSVEGESSDAVIRALIALNEVWTTPSPDYDKFISRMVLIRTLLQPKKDAGREDEIAKAVRTDRQSRVKEAAALHKKRAAAEESNPALKEAREALKKVDEEIKNLKTKYDDVAAAGDGDAKNAAKKAVEEKEQEQKELVTKEEDIQKGIDGEDGGGLARDKLREAAQGIKNIAGAAIDAASATAKTLAERMADLARGSANSADPEETVANIAKSCDLPPIIISQLLKLRDFQVGLACQGEVNLQLGGQGVDPQCALDAVIANSNYWLTSGLFVKSGAVGDMPRFCTKMANKLYSYSHESCEGCEGYYTVSNIRKALANTISVFAREQKEKDNKTPEQRQKEEEAAKAKLQEEVKERVAAAAAQEAPKGGGRRPKKRRTRRRKKPCSRRRGKKKRRSRRHARKGGAVCPVPNPLPVSTAFQ